VKKEASCAFPASDVPVHCAKGDITMGNELLGLCWAPPGCMEGIIAELGESGIGLIAIALAVPGLAKKFRRIKVP